MARIAEGPGTELKKLLEHIGITEREGCSCEQLMHLMNTVGVVGCQDDRFRASILHTMHKESGNWGWTEKLSAGFKAARAGLPLSLEGMYDEAVERAAQSGIKS